MNKYLFIILWIAISVSSVQANGFCSSSTCGENTFCEERNGVAVCQCKTGYTHRPGGDTIEGCPIPISSRKNTQNINLFASQTLVRNRPQRPSVVHFGQGENLHGNRISAGNNIAAVRIDGESPCNPDPCGRNTKCTARGNRAVCACLNGYHGNPYIQCDQSPCDIVTCGTNAECEERGNEAVCRCPPGYRGDPFTRCEADPCLSRSTCHVNADCAVVTSRNGFASAQCTCRGAYQGDGYRECYLDPCSSNPCGINAECTSNGKNYQCNCPQGYQGNARSRCNLNPCSGDVCGPNSDCTPQGEIASCSCKIGYVGSPASRQGCQLDPCSRGVCGEGAECESRSRSAICRCPNGFSGDPYHRCTADPCAGNPCGRAALCENKGNSHFCKCPTDYYGNPNEACIFDPCAVGPCGRNAQCQVRGDQAICSCQTGYTGSPNSRSGCQPDPCSIANICGQGARCINEGSRPTCVCETGFLPYPDAFQGCVRGECTSNKECGFNQACSDFRCVNPCQQSCGTGASCEARNHVAICKCPPGTSGNPFENCRQITRDELCQACGPNTDCNIDITRSGEQRPICSCKQYYIGDALSRNGCRHDCESDNECSNDEKCSRVSFRCEPVCDQDACGTGANCEAQNHRARCTCPQFYRGSPHTRCEPECIRHTDCPETQACIKFQCKDPCFEPQKACGHGADCFVKRHKGICSCPKGYTGNPFENCRKFTRADLCSPNPCGSNAVCQPGFDNNRNDKPVCSCPQGYRGDPLISCVRGDCFTDTDCPSNLACFNFRCESPCNKGLGQGCGDAASCKVIKHAAVCACLPGHAGDPVISCTRIQEGSQTQIFSRN